MGAYTWDKDQVLDGGGVVYGCGIALLLHSSKLYCTSKYDMIHPVRKEPMTEDLQLGDIRVAGDRNLYMNHNEHQQSQS